MAKKKYTDEDFFDDEGNLVDTAWSLKQKEEEAKQERIRAEKERRESLRKTNRQFAIDQRLAKFEKDVEKNNQTRRLREDWLKLPKWIRSMPRTPLTAPPTQGFSNIMRHNLTGKVVLTDEERSQRERDLQKMKTAIYDYTTIHRSLPNGHPCVCVAVVPLGHEVGATMISRAISASFAENRADLGVSSVISLGVGRTMLSSWYDQTIRRQVMLKSVLNLIRGDNEMNVTMTDVFLIGGEGEFLLENHQAAERRVDPSFEDVIDLYRFCKDVDGVLLFDCDASDQDSIEGALAICHTPIFVLPMARDASDRLSEALSRVKQNLDDASFQELLDHSIIVISGVNTKLQGKEATQAMKKLAYKVASENGILKSNIIVIPFTKALHRVPLAWDKLPFDIAHQFRSIAGMIVSNIVGKVKPNTSINDMLRISQ